MTEIRWEPWSSAAFERAARERKPVLLSISAVWCHWCHVMDRTTYADAAVTAMIDERYVAVRVDNDLRPDVNARYNMGGWPTTAFLAPDGTTITGATYLPPEQMLRALGEIATFYAANASAIEQRGNELRGRRRTYEPERAHDLNDDAVNSVIEAAVQTYDATYGGFGEAPKFPQTDALELLLLEGRVRGDERLIEMAANTLRHMAEGGTYDHEEGGFFRYSTTRDWSVPHFEKMSEDHAGLLRALAQLAALRDDVWIARTLRSASAYVRTVLRDPQTGLFAGSQDADEAYYAQTLEQRRTMTAPFVDRRAYAGWTSGLAGAFFAVADALGDAAVAEEARRTLDALHERMRDADGLLYHVLPPDGAPAIRGLLGDQASYARALLDTHERTGETRFLDRARALLAAVERRFSAPGGGFYDHAAMEEQIGNLTIADRPIGENASLADSYLRLASLLQTTREREVAERVLPIYGRTYANAGLFASPYARVLRRYLAAQTSVALVGSPEETAALRAAARALPDPLVTLRTIAPAHSDALRERGFDPQLHPAAYVCHGTLCGAPVRVPEDLRGAYDALVRATTA